MKLFKKILIFLMIAIVFQGTILLYLERYYFNYESDIKKNISKNGVVPSQSEVVIKVSENSSNFKNSFDGKFISYLNGNNIYVIDTKTGKTNNITLIEDGKVDYYKWLENTNKIVFAENISYNNGVQIKLYYYDPVNNSTEEIKGKNLGNSMAIQDENIKAKVSQIEISSITNTFYVKIDKLGLKTSIYKINSESSVKKPIILTNSIGNIVVTPGEGNLYYEDSLNHKIKNSSGQTVNIANVAKPVLLGSDSSNNIYIADTENGVTKKIYWGIINGNSNNWQYKELNSKTELKNIYISTSGKIYLNDNLMGTVTELTTGGKNEYNGILQSMYDKGIASIYEGKLVNTLFK